MNCNAICAFSEDFSFIVQICLFSHIHCQSSYQSSMLLVPLSCPLNFHCVQPHSNFKIIPFCYFTYTSSFALSLSLSLYAIIPSHHRSTHAMIHIICNKSSLNEYEKPSETVAAQRITSNNQSNERIKERSDWAAKGWIQRYSERRVPIIYNDILYMRYASKYNSSKGGRGSIRRHINRITIDVLSHKILNAMPIIIIIVHNANISF